MEHENKNRSVSADQIWMVKEKQIEQLEAQIEAIKQKQNVLLLEGQRMLKEKAKIIADQSKTIAELELRLHNADTGGFFGRDSIPTTAASAALKLAESHASEYKEENEWLKTENEELKKFLKNISEQAAQFLSRQDES